MDNQDASIWLGSARNLIRKAMLAFTIAVVGLSLWHILGILFFGSELGLKQFLSPTEVPLVLATEIAGALALLFASIYFSDFQGAIEPEPEGFFDIFSLVCARLTMFAVVAVVSVMFFEVISRYLFGKPTLWANELSLWIAGFVFLLAGLYAQQQRSHIRIYIIYDMFPWWLQKVSDVISVFLFWVFTVSLIWGGFNESWAKLLRWETFGTAWDPPLPATTKPGILIIITLVAIQGLSNLIADWHKAPESHTPTDDIDESEIEHIRQSIKD